ncbi:MAG: methyltransferase domain-containing protein [Alistipes sp.]|nr:methyltransferase domain-containing protein [Alistipes sp.]
MLTLNDLDILRTEEVRRAIDENIERDPAKVALSKGVPHATLVATQVKYLQRARRKLPALYEARCIIPPRAFEQCSSQESARRKPLSGGSVLDMTCGLGIDTMALAEHFERVVSIERDEVLAEVVRYNMSLLGIQNVEVVTASSEEYVASTSEHFDWVFVDPDRRSAEGKKMVCMEDCSPNVVALMPRLREFSERVAIKLSPMFDCAEAFRLCSPAEVEVVSIGGECKEVNIYTNAERDMLRIAVIGDGEWSFDSEAMAAEPSAEAFAPEEYRYLLVPDVALQKARVAIAALKPYASIWSNNGYAFARELPAEALPARIYEIESIEPYRPKELKRRWKGEGVEFMKRDCALSIEAVRRATATRPGGERLFALTTIAGDTWVIGIKQLQ